MPVLTAAILRDPRDNEPQVPDNKKITFLATAQLNVRCPLSEFWKLNAYDRVTRDSQFYATYTPY
jgi:hypothetical protein